MSYPWDRVWCLTSKYVLTISYYWYLSYRDREWSMSKELWEYRESSDLPGVETFSGKKPQKIWHFLHLFFFFFWEKKVIIHCCFFPFCIRTSSPCLWRSHLLQPLWKTVLTCRSPGQTVSGEKIQGIIYLNHVLLIKMLMHSPVLRKSHY